MNRSRPSADGHGPRALLRAWRRISPQAMPEPDGEAWWLFERPVEVLRADRLDRVRPLLRRVEGAARSGLWAVGFVTYEAAPAFDPAFRTVPAAPDRPLAWFGLFGEPRAVDPPGREPVAGEEIDAGRLGNFVPSMDERTYLEALAAIKASIALGETYQANLTYRLRGTVDEGPPSALALFRRLIRKQPSRYAAYLELGRAAEDADGERGSAVCSASPELFFERSGSSLLCRPMKGTAARGRTTAEDRKTAQVLGGSPKERAENLMIVDMVRNDLGRIARPGSVRVPELFRVERYPTLFQMTSEVTAESDASLDEVFGALFPCASITGAPKVRTMELLSTLETTPRGIYTGAVGVVAPGGDARFSVAIRTAWVDGPDGQSGLRRVEYGTGSGVVWDSDPRRELAETRTKTLALTGDPHRSRIAEGPSFRLLETLRWDPRKSDQLLEGYALLDRHLARLLDSAEYFGFAVDPEVVRARLVRAARELLSAPERPRARAAGPWRVRLLVDPEGNATTEAKPLGRGDRPGGVWVVALADDPVDPTDPYLFHKTTHREVYERAARCAPGADDVLLWNPEGELTETTVANLVLELEDGLFTPELASGLLAGTYRAELLEQGIVRERRLFRKDLDRAARLWLVNSVRGWIPAILRRAAWNAGTIPSRDRVSSPPR